MKGAIRPFERVFGQGRWLSGPFRQNEYPIRVLSSPVSETSVELEAWS